jgi:succinate dehydrogenase / fumarate reductase cytochrome b subunit
MEATTSAAPENTHGTYVTNKLASLLAFAPLGVWTCVHVWNNLASFRGAKEWEESVSHHGHPATVVLTSIVVLAPLLLHTIWGIGRLRTMKLNNGSYGYFANLKFLLQRLSALGVLLFIGAHTWLAFLHPRLVEHHAEQFNDIAAEMAHNPPTLVVYLLGTLGVAYHFGNGISGFAWNWGLAGSRKAVRHWDKVGLTVFVILLCMSWAAIYGLFRAGMPLQMH